MRVQESERERDALGMHLPGLGLSRPDPGPGIQEKYLKQIKVFPLDPKADLLLSSAEHLLEILHPQRLQRLLARSVRDSHVWSRDSHVWVVSRACLRVGVADAGPYTINPKP